jgi:adenylate cyclase
VEKRHFIAIVTITLVATMLSVSAIRGFPFLSMMGQWVVDLRIANLTPAEPKHSDIVIVAVNEDTLSQFPYRSPLDRQFLSRVINDLADKGARAVLVDFLFDQATEPAKDKALFDSLRNVGKRLPLVVAYGNRDEGLTEAQAAYIRGYVAPEVRAFANLAKDPLSGVARGIYLGRTDTDGAFVRGMVPRMAERLGLDLPEDSLPIIWRGRPDDADRAFRVFPAQAIKVIPKAMLAGKIVLIGSDLTLTDRHRTPFATALGERRENNTPGVFIHAHALAQLVDDRRSIQIGLGREIALIAAITLLVVGGALAFDSYAIRFPILGLTLVTIWIGGFVIFRQVQVMVPLITPTMSMVAAALGIEIYFGWTQREGQRRLKLLFSRYLSPALFRELLKDPSKLELGGEVRQVTYLFTDIANFTHLTEVTDPKVLTGLLNEYLTNVTEIILSHDGTIDKIIGDAVVTMFGAPLAQDDDPARAVKCAMAIDAYAEAFRVRVNQRGIPFGVTRIGVNTGDAVIGNFGGEAYFNYTGLGDTVNTAARLESVNKHIGTRICVGETTVARSAGLDFRPVARLVLKGKTEATKAYEPIQNRAARSEFFDTYDKAYLTMEREGDGAAACFTDLCAAFPDDPLANFHKDRLQASQTERRQRSKVIQDLIVMDEK